MKGRRSKHSLSHYRLLTGDMGQILPVGLVEVLPGDSFQHSASTLVRLSPMAAPVMHPVTIRMHHFFVPHRLVWPEESPTTWENFITGGPDGREATPIPTLATTGTEKDLLDYYGLPTVAGINVSSLPVRGFNAIYNEYYRDQDLVTERAEEDVTVPLCAWEKDYFTTARPWPQKGEDVTLPLGTSAPVRGIGAGNQEYGDSGTTVYESGGHTASYGPAKLIGDTADRQFYVNDDVNNPGYPHIWADLSEAAAAKVNDIRKAFALQRFAEARARYGSRYTEYLRFLGITPSDARLDRPEYLGGGRVRASISEVLQTANDTGASGGQDRGFGVGDMYGHGIAATRSNAYRRFFEEHGYVHSFISVRPKAMYTNGVERTWLRRDREDFWQKELQWIGQQTVLEQEVYATAANQDAVFGYSDRYQEYRYQRSLVTSEFRTTLDYWHLAREFASIPGLNQTFTDCNPSKRIFNEQTQNSLWIMVQHNLVARRLVARNASPRIF